MEPVTVEGTYFRTALSLSQGCGSGLNPRDKKQPDLNPIMWPNRVWIQTSRKIEPEHNSQLIFISSKILLYFNVGQNISGKTDLDPTLRKHRIQPFGTVDKSLRKNRIQIQSVEKTTSGSSPSENPSPDPTFRKSRSHPNNRIRIRNFSLLSLSKEISFSLRLARHTIYISPPENFLNCTVLLTAKLFL